MNKSLALWFAGLSHSATPSIDECVAQLKHLLPYLEQFKETEQDPEWHGEGNVFIHTGMVLDELYQLLQSTAAHIYGERRQALILGALLHDIAKPLCTRRREINGIERIVSPRHEAHGRSYLAYKLMGCGLSYRVVELVLGLVGEHHMPKLLVIKNQGQGDYLSLSRRADCELLYFLEVADMSGRLCPDKDKQLEYLDLFKLFCLEYQLWGEQPSAYQQWQRHLKQELAEFDADTQDLIYGNAIRDRERGLITSPEEAIAKSYGYREAYGQVVLMCGPSGSGKTSWIRNNLEAYHIVSLDDLREELSGDRANQSVRLRGQILQEAKSRLKHHLRSHHSVVWDATNLRCDFRTQICDLAYAYQALVTLVVFQQKEDNFYQGNGGRAYAVPEKVLQKQIETMEWPLPNESHRYLVIGEDHQVLRFYGGLQDRNSPF